MILKHVPPRAQNRRATPISGWLFWVVLALALALIWAGLARGPGEAENSLLNELPTSAGTSQLSIGASVVRYASLEILAVPATLRVGEADIKRGYVSASGASIRLKSNARDGFLMSFAVTTPDFGRISVRGLDQPVDIDGASGSAFIPSMGSGMQTATKDLTFQLELAPGMKPGEYDWPVRMSVTP